MPLNADFIIIIIAVAACFIMMLFFLGLYKKFNPNDFIIHLHNGKVKYTGLGGRCFILPFIDEIVKIPAQIQITKVEIKHVHSATNHETTISASIIWQVIKPEVANTIVSWDREKPNFVDQVMNELATGTFIEESLKIETDWNGTAWIVDLKQSVVNHLYEKIHDYGIVINSVEIHLPDQESAKDKMDEESSLLIREPSE